MIRSFQIFWNILLPIFIMIFSGYLLQKKFKLTLAPLIKIQLYLFIPTLIFLKIATSTLQGNMIFLIVTFTILLFFILAGISTLIARILKLNRKKEKAFINAVTLRNQGNFGIPLISLLFVTSGNDYALSIHMIVLFTTNILLNTIGLYNTSSGSYTKKQALEKVLKMPMIYVIILGFIFKGFQLPIPTPFSASLSILGNGVVPLALFTLGAQLATTKLAFDDISLPIAVVMRLIVSPIIAAIMTYTLGISGVMAQVLVIGSAAPSAVNSVLLAVEFNGDAEYASKTVLLTTVLSAITVTITILFTT